MKFNVNLIFVYLKKHFMWFIWKLIFFVNFQNLWNTYCVWNMTLTQIMLWIEQHIECSIIWLLIEFISNFGIDISGGMAICLHFLEPVLKVQLKGFSLSAINGAEIK